MPMEWKLEVLREVKLVSLGITVALLIVGLVALVEKGPQVPAIPVGPSPLSPLSYGTLSLYEIARSTYRTAVILKPEDLSRVSSSRCLYVLISPTVPVDRSSAVDLVVSLRKSCRVLAVLIADEETTSNGLLEALNSTIRIVGNRVGAPYSAGISYFPKATVLVGEKAFTVTLDLASEVGGGKTSGYAIGITLEAPPAIKSAESSPVYPEAASSLRVVAVASEEVVGGVHVYALGDGSILLNQVLSSGNHVYRELAKELLDYLCAVDKDCTIVFGAYHYSSVDPYTVLSGEARAREAIASFLDVLYVATAALLVVLHPAVWLPQALGLAESYLRLLTSSPLAYAVIPLVALYFSRFFYSGERAVRDRPASEQVEKDVYIAPDLRKSVLRGAVKLDSRDFVNLYNMVNAAVSALVGVELSDESFPKVLSRYVGGEKAFEYWRKMNKLYRRATRKSFWPPIVFWRKTVLRSLGESEVILDSLSESLTKSLGVEYLAILGGRIGGVRQENQ